MDAGEKVDSTRDSTGGVGRKGEGGREGDRARGEREAVSYRRGGIPTDSDRGGSRGGPNAFSEVASLRASSNGLTTAVSTADLTGSTNVPSIWTAGIGCGCGGCGVVESEGMADVDADGIGDDDGNGEKACSCQYMESSLCSSSSASRPCWFLAVAACASAKNPAVEVRFSRGRDGRVVTRCLRVRVSEVRRIGPVKASEILVFEAKAR
jgi:hypothetical protein